MKPKLHVRVLGESSHNVYDVAWYLSPSKHGIYRVDVNQEKLPNKHENPVVAELVALRRLIANDDSPLARSHSHKTIEVAISKGAVVRLLRKQSTLSSAYPYASFLRTRFRKLDIEVRKDMDAWENNEIDINAEPVEPITVNAVERHPHYITHVAGIGPLALTEHALDRYEEIFLANESDAIKDSYKSLMNRLKNPDLKMYGLPRRARMHKAVTYKSTDRTEYWRHPDGKELFVIVLDTITGLRTLVTTALPTQGMRKEQFAIGRKSIAEEEEGPVVLINH